MNTLPLPHSPAQYFAVLLQIPEFKEVIEGLREVIRLIYGDQAPGWILPLIGYILLGAAILIGLLALLTIVSKIKDLLTDKFWPVFYNKEKARRSNRRRKFADHIESELRRLNNLEAWSDYRFAELEAEVDAEGRRRLFGILPSLYRTSNTLRRERSLSKALALSEERLVIVEGDPGSGKSVALRHVATLLAKRAMKSRSATSVIPIYVNLKEIERKKGQRVDRNLIAAFVLKVLNRVNDRDVEEFLEEEFDDGLQNGTWFFLFDSFDEIPEVLGSTEADKIIAQYATAISDFLHGLNQCRGVVASRSFHGPKQFGWARFTILPLSSNRRIQLIRRAGLKAVAELELLGRIETIEQEITSMASNPMFLGLLCEHMRSGYPFPENSHTVFETYINSRLTRDSERLYQRFRLQPHELRTTAEALAFCMAADTGLGLSPSRTDIITSANKLQIELDKRLNKILDAITYLKIARADTSTSTDKSDQFTFSHRRFQEYFATAVVLREPTKITVRQLLTDARWRETAIVLCQTQTPETLASFLEEAKRLIQEFADAVEQTYNDEYDASLESKDKRSTNGDHENTIWSRFYWPSNALHVFSLLQEGLGRKPNFLSYDTRENIARVLDIASFWGISADQKWALDVSGIAPEQFLTHLLRFAFNNKSQVLKDSAYKQVARLARIPNDLAFSIRSTLCVMALTRRLRKERTATHAHLARLSEPSNYFAVLRLLLWVPTIDFSLHFSLAILLLFDSMAHLSFPLSDSSSFIAVPIFIALFSVPLSYFLFYWAAISGTRRLGILFTDIRDENRAQAIGLFFMFFNLRTFLILGSAVIASFLTKLDAVEIPTDLLKQWIPIWFYIALWAPSAILLASGGRFMSLVFWPFYPILALAKSIRALASTVPAVVVQDWRDLLGTVLKGLAFYAIIILLGYAGSFVPHSALIAVTGASATLLSAIGFWVYVKVRDLPKWRAWNQQNTTTMNAHEFISNVRSYHSEKYRVRFINAVRKRGLIPPSPEAQELIYCFAKELEPRHSHKSTKSLFRKVLSTLSFEPNSEEKKYPYGVAVLDEVLKMLEQIRASQ